MISKKMALIAMLAGLSLAMGGCGDDDGDTPDSGGTDTGTPDEDSGTPDEDSGTSDEDSGTPDEDSGTPDEDSGTPDEDAGMMMSGCPDGYAGCDTFMDLTGAGTAMIGITGFMYMPKCVRVNVGQMVEIEGALIHPLMGSCGPGDMNPIPDMSMTPQTVTFDTPGVYGFHCNNHGAPSGTGMSGAIEVVAP